MSYAEISETIRQLEEENALLRARNGELRDALDGFKTAIHYFNNECRPDRPLSMVQGWRRLWQAVEAADALLAKESPADSPDDRWEVVEQAVS